MTAELENQEIVTTVVASDDDRGHLTTEVPEHHAANPK